MAYTFELNNERKDSNFVSGKINANSPVVEIFSAMVGGKDLSKYGRKADEAVKYIKELSSKANMGDMVAQSELNALRTMAIQPALLEEIKLLGIFGSYEALDWNDSAEVEVSQIVDSGARVQAEGQDVPFPVLRKKRVPVATVTVSGGHAVNYRKAMVGDMSDEYALQEQVRIQIRNLAAKYVVDIVYAALTASGIIKYNFQGAGLTKAGVDGVIGNVRRFGKPTVIGDYALVSQFNGFAGYQGVTPSINGISEAVMNEIHQTGLIGMYNGAIISEMPNPFDLTTLNAAGTNFVTLLDPGIGFVVPAGVQSPIHTITRGGLTSFTGNDVSTGEILTRFDLQVGAIVEPGNEYKIGVIEDTNL